MDLSFLSVLFPMLMVGLRTTVIVAVSGIIIGFLLGALSGYALHSKTSKIGKAISGGYIWIIRGTPIIVQALYIYYVIPIFIRDLFDLKRFTLDATLAGIIIIALNSGAFIAAIVKGSLDSVDIGQTEAGKSLGLTNFQILIHLIVPPAFNSMLPALFNQFIVSVKDTALLTVISMNDILRQAQNYIARTYDTMNAYNTVAVFYLVIISVLMILHKYIEKKTNS